MWARWRIWSRKLPYRLISLLVKWSVLLVKWSIWYSNKPDIRPKLTDDSAIVMLMTTLCWWLDNGDGFNMLVSKSLSSCLFFHSVSIFFNVMNRWFRIGHQHLKSVINTFRLQHRSSRWLWSYTSYRLMKPSISSPSETFDKDRFSDWLRLQWSQLCNCQHLICNIKCSL